MDDVIFITAVPKDQDFFEAARLIGQSLPERPTTDFISHLAGCIRRHGARVAAGLLEGLNVRGR
jgi:hypothetical protein